MPILEIKNEIEVEITHQCNWNCPYCAIHTHTLPPISESQAISKIQSIPENSIVTLSGGEPGLISRNTILKILDILNHKNCVVNLNTNGKFLENFNDLIYLFNIIVYHCSEDLYLEKVLYNSQWNNIQYMIIVHDNNYSRLPAFLEFNPNITFNIVEATYNKKDDGPTLSPKNKYNLIKTWYKRMTKDSIYRMFKGKNFDLMQFI